MVALARMERTLALASSAKRPPPGTKRDRLRPYVAAVLLVCPLAAMGCAGSSDYMADVKSPAALAAPADKAGVVFVRPSGLGFAINFAVLDQNGTWIGDAVAKAHFAVMLPPGDYMFVGWAENTAALKATVAAGRLYYVQVVPTMGFGSAHVRLEALTPRSADWSQLNTWLGETKRLESLPAGVAHIQERHEDAMKRVASARENWDGYSAEDKELRTLRVGDGVASGGATPVAEGVAVAVQAPAAVPAGAPAPAVPPSPAVAATPPAAGGCGMDTDCKGDRICQGGQCVAPSPVAPPRVTREGACTKDTECKGDRICVDGQCVAPRAAVPAKVR